MTQIVIIPGWIQTLSAFLVPLIAIVTASIIILQYILARQRWRLDLYAKRYPVFSATMIYLSNISRDRNITDEELNKFLRDSKEKDFLFGKDVQQFLNELYKKGVDYRLYKHQIESRVFPDKKHEQLVEKEEALFEWFMEQFGVSTSLFKKYLSIAKK